MIRPPILYVHLIYNKELINLKLNDNLLNFWIENKTTNKLVSEGHFVYTMVSVKSGRPVRITDEIIERYSI